MNPSNNPLQPTPGSLPQPAVYAESEKLAESAQQDQPVSPLQQMPSIGGQSQAGAIPPAVPQPTLSAIPAAPTMPSQQAGNLPAAEDADDLNVQWLHATEGLMRQHIQDPKVLAREFERLKAQYIASRYGKEVKQSSDEAK